MRGGRRRGLRGKKLSHLPTVYSELLQTSVPDVCERQPIHTPFLQFGDTEAKRDQRNRKAEVGRFLGAGIAWSEACG